MLVVILVFFCLVFFEDLLLILEQLGFGWAECVDDEEFFKCSFSRRRVKISEFLDIIIISIIEFVFSLINTALDARNPCTDCGIFGDFLDSVGVLVHNGVDTVHEGGDLVELLDPLVDETEDRYGVRVLRTEIEVEA